MRKARVRRPQYSRFFTSPPRSAMMAVRASARASTCVVEISWRVMTVVSYNDIDLRLLMAVNDPTLVEQFDGSRSDQAGMCPARSKGAHYTESRLRRKRWTQSELRRKHDAGPI